MNAVMVYITTADKAEAMRIGRALVEERLAACINILEGMTSVYRWEGCVEEASEAVLLAKTAAERVERLTQRVKELHSYECPCVVTWPIFPGNDNYFHWLVSALRSDSAELI